MYQQIFLNSLQRTIIQYLFKKLPQMEFNNANIFETTKPIF